MRSLGALLDINAQLRALGIEQDMHVVDPEDPQADERRLALMTDPVMTAEWLASQVYYTIESGATSKGITAADFEEHDEIQSDGDLSLISAEAMNPRMRAFALDFAAIDALRSFVDYHARPSEVE